MSFNAFMLPAQPQAPAAGLNGPRQAGSADCQSCRPDESTAGGQSFMATLNQVSNSRCDRSRESSRIENAGDNPDHAHASGIAGEMNKHGYRPQIGIEDAGTSESDGPAVCIHPLHMLGLIQQKFFNFLMSANVSNATAGHPDLAAATTFPRLDFLGAPIEPEGQTIQDGQVGIGLFEQLQANVSPDATQLYFFEQLVAGTFNHQNHVDPLGMQTHFWGYGSWMATLSAGNLNMPSDALGFQSNPALTHLLHLQGMDAPVWKLTGQSNGLGEQKLTAQTTTMDLNGEWLLKTSAASQQSGSQTAENTHAPALRNTHDGRLFPLAAGIQDSEILAETKFQQATRNSQMHQLQATERPADQLANPKLAAEVGVAKPIEESLNLKDAVLKNQMPLAAEVVDKVVQIEGENKDSSLLSGQDQMTDRLTRFETATTASESTGRSLSSQAMQQIVQRAVLSFSNGQNEVRIDLKPEFLGQIRLQIVTDSQQVAVRIIAENPFVKDMLESNLNQLKADLQAQGLKVDELEVSVAHDSHNGTQNQTTADATKSNALREDVASEDGDASEQNESPVDDSESISENAIDYFA